MINKLSCHVCNSIDVVKFLERKEVPVHQNYIFESEKTAIIINKGNLELYICKKCGFIFNEAFDINKLQYSEFYDNTQDISNIFNQYIDKEIDFLINDLMIEEKRIVEVGCGKGNFLKKLAVRSNSIGVGFDPSYVGDTEILNGRIKFEKCFYDENCTDVPADIVICRHVIEHVPNPVDMLKNIRKALDGSPNALVFFETPSVKWILDNKIIYDFFYEHCSYFDVTSITKAFDIAGFTVKKIVHDFNGQYMWIIGEISKCNEYTSEFNYKDIDDLEKLAYSYNCVVNKKIEKWKEKIIRLGKNSKVAIWGAGAKGVTFANLIDPKNLYIDCVIDINIHKQGCYLPGTGHKIVNYTDIIDRKIQYVIVMNNNYSDEIEQTLKDNNINVQIILGDDIE
ncbi:class I SAM-dependent methyltransferase [Clostridium estertheticum]|uniref:class I SAM-dependent methyltransferase n=1 Tax=Clostridium estertheticum TaxID=238834 RepID=UPI001CF48255|nr:class I SAM-dependent methyltransferase [Clostridium estertheticum]MCB2359369.1 class I SAM-dependent methyltransferase [Clostridium estertheticum]